jgi:cytochrome c
MPYPAPQSLSPNHVYSLVAYLLWANGIVARDTQLDQRTLPKAQMPNREGLVAIRARSR